ncbi:hypothetical protein RB213_008140 [Colletotrichum asianum]
MDEGFGDKTLMLAAFLASPLTSYRRRGRAAVLSPHLLSLIISSEIPLEGPVLWTTPDRTNETPGWIGIHTEYLIRTR